MTFFKKIWENIKWVAAGIAGIAGIVLFFFVRSKMRAKDHLEYELSRVRNEMEIAQLAEKTEESNRIIEELEKEETVLREKIRLVEEREIKGEEIPLEELDKFFEDRGL